MTRNSSDFTVLPLYLSSSICSSIVTHPIDVMKVRIQTSAHKKAVNVLSTTFKSNGASFLFKGIRASFLRNGSFVTTKMFSYDFFRQAFNTNSFQDKVISGMGAGACGSLVGTPFDLIMVRIQNNPKLYPDIHQTILKTYKNEGISSFWNGLSYTTKRSIVVTACQFSVFEQLKHELKQLNLDKNSVFITSSVLSSMLTGLLSNPFDLCKSRTMNNCTNSTIINIIKKEGVFSLWKGLHFNLGRQVPLNLFRFGFVEFFKQSFLFV